MNGSFEAETRERLAAMEQDTKSVHRRLDSLEELTESIHSIAVEMREMRTSMERMQGDLNKMNNRVEEIEGKPARRYEAFILAAVTAVFSFIAGYFLK